ncbi:unnamed protein product [Didymodactylos carnosus]|nr:unnamed protein product [Didymodactylos carnosus]CAF3583643.1 unnamed protein product [Didymodactylos carnosus]
MTRRTSSDGGSLGKVSRSYMDLDSPTGDEDDGEPSDTSLKTGMPPTSRKSRMSRDSFNESKADHDRSRRRSRRDSPRSRSGGGSARIGYFGDKNGDAVKNVTKCLDFYDKVKDLARILIHRPPLCRICLLCDNTKTTAQRLFPDSKPSALANASHVKSYDPTTLLRKSVVPPPIEQPHPRSTEPLPAETLSYYPPSFSYPYYHTYDPYDVSKQPKRLDTINGLPASTVLTDPNGYIPQPFYYSHIHPENFIPVYDPNLPYQPFLLDNTLQHPIQQYPRPIIQEFQPEIHDITNDPTSVLRKTTDADLSRLEIYHFIPKSNIPVRNTQHELWNAPYHSPYTQPVTVRPSLPQDYYYPPLRFKEARSSQTDKVDTKHRGVSPIMFSRQDYYDNQEDMANRKRITAYTDRYSVPINRINHHSYHTHRPIIPRDCRCLDCQKNNERILNYVE